MNGSLSSAPVVFDIMSHVELEYLIRAFIPLLYVSVGYTVAVTTHVSCVFLLYTVKEDNGQTAFTIC